MHDTVLAPLHLYAQILIPLLATGFHVNAFEMCS